MPTKQEAIEQLLDQFRASSQKIKSAAVISQDGLKIAHRTDQTAVDADSAAAMGAYIMGMAIKAADIMQAGQLSEILISGEYDTILVQKIGGKALLLAQAEKNLQLGFLLFQSRQCRDALEATL